MQIMHRVNPILHYAFETALIPLTNPTRGFYENNVRLAVNKKKTCIENISLHTS